MTRARGIVSVVVGGVVLLVSACSGGGGDDGERAAPSPTNLATAASADPRPTATTSNELGGYCYPHGPETLLTGQPAYRGKGPHPVQLGTSDPSGVPATQAPLPSPGETASAPPVDTYHPDPATVQLIACVANEHKGKLVATCRFMHQADHYVRYVRQGQYTVTLYEARTGRKLGSTKVKGDDRYTCPAQQFFLDGEPQSKTEWLSAGLPAFRKALAPWVDATKP